MGTTRAYQSLSLGAKALLVELYKRHNGVNNGKIPLSVREVSTILRVGRNRPTALFRELLATGFVRIAHKGSYEQKTRHATTWILTEFDYNGKDATKEFMKWRPSGDPESPESTLTQLGEFKARPSNRGCQSRIGGE